jgi:hypothetical protein
LKVVFADGGLINSQDQKAYVEIFIKRCFHGYNDTEEVCFDGNCVVRFDEFGENSMEFWGWSQGNGFALP